MSEPVTIVTGAARGIGAAIADAVAAAGASVAVCDHDGSAAEARRQAVKSVICLSPGGASGL